MQVQQYKWLNILIGINALIFTLYVFLVGIDNAAEINKVVESQILIFGAFVPSQVYLGMTWLTITSAFLHFDPFHFLINMVALYQLGRLTAQLYGQKILVVVYVFGGLTGSLLAYLYALATTENFLSIGASGAIFAMLGLFVGGVLKKKRFETDLPFGLRELMPTLIMAVLINFFPNINWAAHLGGFLLGVVFGYFFRNIGSIQSTKENRIINILFYIAIAIVVLSYLLLVVNLAVEIVPYRLNVVTG